MFFAFQSRSFGTSKIKLLAPKVTLGAFSIYSQSPFLQFYYFQYLFNTLILLLKYYIPKQELWNEQATRMTILNKGHPKNKLFTTRSQGLLRSAFIYSQNPF
jgi:hypothetical protein